MSLTWYLSTQLPNHTFGLLETCRPTLWRMMVDGQDETQLDFDDFVRAVIMLSGRDGRITRTNHPCGEPEPTKRLLFRSLASLADPLKKSLRASLQSKDDIAFTSYPRQFACSSPQIPMRGYQVYIKILHVVERVQPIRNQQTAVLGLDKTIAVVRRLVKSFSMDPEEYLPMCCRRPDPLDSWKCDPYESWKSFPPDSWQLLSLDSMTVEGKTLLSLLELLHDSAQCSMDNFDGRSSANDVVETLRSARAALSNTGSVDQEFFKQHLYYRSVSQPFSCWHLLWVLTIETAGKLVRRRRHSIQYNTSARFRVG